MYAQFNRRIEYIYNNSLFTTAAGESYMIEFNNEYVMVAEVLPDGTVYLEDLDGFNSDMFDAAETDLDTALMIARDLLDLVLAR